MEFSEESGSLYVLELIYMLEDCSYDRDRFFMGDGRAKTSGLWTDVYKMLDIFLAEADLLRGLDRVGGCTS